MTANPTRSIGFLLIALTTMATILAGCGSRTSVTLPPSPTSTAIPSSVSSTQPWLKQPPEPLQLPRDEAPHDVLTEWWYYTGHLDAATGERYGFEFVVFQVGLGGAGTTYISHVAVTDLSRGTFVFDQRLEAGPQPQQPGSGFSLKLGDWLMTGRDGSDRLRAGVGDVTFDLSLTGIKPPALHLGSGYMSFGPAGDSYYYSRTRMAVAGTLVDRGTPKAVAGSAWFDKQWGNFVSVKGGGWDWYAVQLDNGDDVMIFDVRSPAGNPSLLYGTYVERDGTVRELLPGAFSIEVTGQWLSPRSGASYPAGWRIQIPGQALDIVVMPFVANQELDTRETTGVVYWEGAVGVVGHRLGLPVSGRGYVELTGYAR